MPEISVDDQDWRGLVQLAAEHHGGDVQAALHAALAVVWATLNTGPTDLWHEPHIQAVAALRPWPAYRVPVADLIDFVAFWDDKPDATGRDVLTALMRSMTRRPGDTHPVP